MPAENHTSLEMEKRDTSHQQLLPNGNGQLSNNTKNEVEVLTSNDHVPKAVPEFTDEEDDFDDRPFTTDTRIGVDDGFLPSNDESDSKVPRIAGDGSKRPSFSFPGYEGPGVVEVNGVITPIPDVNAYQHKKTLAQGMMDLALLSANANQLRYVLESYKRHPYYYPSLIFISISIIFQVAVGVGLILNSRYNIKDEKEICRANKINNYTIIGVFVVTVVNVFISAFGVADPPGEK